MREVVIILPDLYPVAAEAQSRAVGALPGLEHIVRFGSSSVLSDGWRSWLARWAGRSDLADAAPATVAAAAVGDLDEKGIAWLATPVHFVASMTSLHLGGHGLLRLSPTTLGRLARDFAQVFGDSGYRLWPLPSGELLAVGPPAAPARTMDPARYLGANVESALPSGPGAPALRRLSAELEMWLHDHPVNLERERRGQLRISTLWLWGGGPVPITGQERFNIDTPSRDSSVAYATDSYVQGLWRLNHAETRPLPSEFAAVLEAPAERAILVVDALRPDESVVDERGAAQQESLSSIDCRWIVPMLDALRSGTTEQVTLVANDRRLTLRAHDRLKLWRRPRAALAGLL